jgi:rhodanese-related sulfurtransferase
MLNILKSLFSSGNSNEALKIALNDDAFLVDVRTPEEFSAGHVRGSVNIPLNTIPNKLNSFKNKKHIVVFCRSGNRSSQAKYILEQNGFKNVINGGTWQKVKQLKSA